MASKLEPVYSQIEPELREQLRQKREESGRSESKEIRQALRAWCARPADAPPDQLTIGVPS
jgi:hypothetical protein